MSWKKVTWVLKSYKVNYLKQGKLLPVRKLLKTGVCTSLTFKNVLALLVHYADKIGLTAVQQVHVYIHFYEVQLVQSFSEAVFFLRNTSEH